MITVIYDVIAREVLRISGINRWLASRSTIYNKLEELWPSIPEDGSVGRIAFNVLGKERMKIKTGRFLTRKLNLNNGFLSDKSIAIIADKINIAVFPDIRTELVSGRTITVNYRDEVGAITCMTPNGDGGGPTCTKLYENNPDRFQMLAMFYMNDSARAIVHRLDNDRYYMDRIYASCEMLKELMRDYAKKQDWHYRLTDMACDYSISCSESELVVSELDYNDGEVPYMDTMINGCVCGTRLSISANGHGDYELTSTNGQLERGGYVCDNCGDRTPEDEQRSIGSDVYCQSCVDENYSFCESCCEYVSNDDIIHVEDTDDYFCTYCISEKAVKCENCGDYYKDDYIVIENNIYCINCAERYPICSECNEQFIDSDCIDENGLCEDCRPELVIVSSTQLNLPDDYVGQMEFDNDDS